MKKSLYWLRHLMRPTGGGVAILYFHRILDDSTPSSDWRRLIGHCDISTVRRQIDYLRTVFDDIIPLSRALELLDSGDLRRNYAVLTVDDGYADFATNLLPILNETHTPATLFVCSGAIETGTIWFQQLYDLIDGVAGDSLNIPFVGQVPFRDTAERLEVVERILNKSIKELPFDAAPLFVSYILEDNPITGRRPCDRFATVEELRALSKSNLVELYPHSHFHHPFHMLTDAQLAEDLRLCQTFFRDTLGLERNILSYPNGRAPKDMEPLSNAGIKSALTTISGVERRKSAERYRLHRLALDARPLESLHVNLLRHWHAGNKP